MSGLRLKELLKKGPAEKMRLAVVAGVEGLTTILTNQRIQKPGLHLTSLLEELHPDRLQIFGAAEIGYLQSLSANKLLRSLNMIERTPIPAIVITRGVEPPDFLIELAERKSMPLFTTELDSSVLIEMLTGFLDENLAPEVTLHGVLVDVMGIGILIMGKSGIGKSECALDLISRGYRLVADDAVIVRKRLPASLFGVASDIISYHMEVRGIGIVNIKDIFGITAIRNRKQMDMVVELTDWDPEREYERLGYEETNMEILGVNLPYLTIPVSPGRSVATIVEVAARTRILKIMGYDSSKSFDDHLNKILRERSEDAE